MLALLARYDYATKSDLSYVQCFEYAELQRLRNELGWKGRLVLLAGGKTPLLDSDASLKEIAQVVDGIGPPLSAVAEGRKPTGLVERALTFGLKVHPYILRTDALPKGFADGKDYYRFLKQEAKADGLFTDFPDVTR